VYLQEHGAEVEMTDDADRAAIRVEQAVPDNVGSCHTAIVEGCVVEGCVVEGHVPVGAIERLLQDRPDAVGRALPGMPADSPGMGGDINTWERQPVILVGRDATLTRFDY
jgi:hypothetical protein